MKSWKYVGIIIMIIGFWHLQYELRSDWGYWTVVAQHGFFNTISLDTNQEGPFWSLVFAMLLILLGYTGYWVQKNYNAILPVGFALMLLIFGAITSVLIPGGPIGWQSWSQFFDRTLSVDFLVGFVLILFILSDMALWVQKTYDMLALTVMAWLFFMLGVSAWLYFSLVGFWIIGLLGVLGLVANCVD